MRRPWLATLAVAVLASPAASATSLHTVRVDDFSLSVPSDWRTLTHIGTVRLITTTKVPQGGFYVNANVVVTPDAGGPQTEIRARLLQAFRGAGITITSLAIGNGKLPAGNATVMRYRGTMAGHRLRWLAYIFHAHGRAYVLTFTASATTFGRNAGLFASMARSFRIG
jgi:hypothetical protein